METIRCFLAIPVKDDKIITKVKELQEKLSSSGADIKIVEKENIHYNLKFFGEKTKDEVNKIISAIENVLGSKRQFEIEVWGLGTFPAKDFVRVVWLGIKKGEKEMVSLAQELENSFSAIGIEKEIRPFQAHLTLCRVRSVDGIESLKNVVNKESSTDVSKMLVNEVVLYQSILKKEGPEYIEIKRFRLLK